MESRELSAENLDDWYNSRGKYSKEVPPVSAMEDNAHGACRAIQLAEQPGYGGGSTRTQRPARRWSADKLRAGRFVREAACGGEETEQCGGACGVPTGAAGELVGDSKGGGVGDGVARSSSTSRSVSFTPRSRTMEPQETQDDGAESKKDKAPARMVMAARQVRRQRTFVGEMFKQQIAAPSQPAPVDQLPIRRWRRENKVHKRMHSKCGRAANSAVSQSTGGDAGSTGNARMLDTTHPTLRVLLYRLVSLPNPDNPWGDGLLLQMAREHATDDALFLALGALMQKRWCDDPLLERTRRDAGKKTSFRRAGAGGKQGVKRSAFSAPPQFRQTVPVVADDGDSFSGGWKKADSDDTWGHVLVHGRGTVGETALHLLFLVNSPAHRRLTKLLVPLLSTQRTPDVDGVDVNVLDASYIGQPYHGEVCLHFAIVHNDLAMVKVLVESGADCCSPHASGDFFYEHRALYFGGSCLGFAACMGLTDIVNYLLTNEHCKADPNQLDRGPYTASRTFHPSMARENTVLHCLVLHDQEELYRTLVDEYGANPWSQNIHGDTPLLLACRRSLNMAQAAMIASRQMVWSYASVACVRYPLYEIEGEGFGQAACMQKQKQKRSHEADRGSSVSERLDDEPSGGSRYSAVTKRHHHASRKSVLSVVTRERVASLLYSDVLWKLINDKWHVFGRPRFFWFAAVSLICQMLLTLSLCRRPVAEEAVWLLQPGDRCEGVLVLLIVPLNMNISRQDANYCFCASLGLNAILLLRLLFAMARLGTNTRSGFFRQLLGVLAHLMPWMALLVYELSDQGLGRVVHGFAAFLGWLHFMKVCFSFQVTLGPMVLLVEEMVRADLTVFLLIYLGYMHAFAAIFSGLFTGIGMDAPSGYDMYLRLLRYTVNPDIPTMDDRLKPPDGEEPYQFITNTTASSSVYAPDLLFFYQFLEFIWGWMSNIVLLNLLIAMMSNRYQMIMEIAETQWRLQFADLVLLQEATPWWFVPLPYAVPWSADASRRPKHHVPGKLTIMDEQQEKKEIDCFFLMMEVVSSESGGEKETTDEPPESMFGGRHNDAEVEKEQTKLLRGISTRLEKMEQKIDEQQRDDLLCIENPNQSPSKLPPSSRSRCKASNAPSLLAASLGGEQDTNSATSKKSWGALKSSLEVPVCDSTFHALVRKAKACDQVPGKVQAMAQDTVQNKVRGKLAVSQGDSLAASKTSVLPVANVAREATTSEPDMTVEAATRLILEGAMNRLAALDA